MLEVKLKLKEVGYWELICFMWKYIICAFCAVVIPTFILGVLAIAILILSRAFG